jgi:DNA repair and recombination RAD54-like protein
MVDFCNPGVLGSPAEFRKHFEAPILAGREPGAAPEVAGEGMTRV